MTEPSATRTARESAPFPHTKSYQRLQQLAERDRDVRVAEELQSNTERPRLYQASAAGWLLDYSRNLITDDSREALLALAAESGLEEAREGLFDGRTLNQSEGRAVLHTLLRASTTSSHLQAELDAVTACRAKMAEWVQRVHSGDHRGFDNKPIRHVVNIGIGGSDLGPRLVVEALRPYHADGIQVHFCANVDPAEFRQTVQSLDPAQTLFIVCSKTLRTEETLYNARLARQWILDAGASEALLERHFLAVSTNLAGAQELGIPPQNILPMWDWVGGRYSLWSAIGWSIAFAVGNRNFEALLAGARAMDEHFRTAATQDNLPIWLSLLEIWYVNILGCQASAVLPYYHDLHRLPSFLQQLSMESNGKRVNHSGKPLGYATAPVLWGAEGTNGQHSFHQLLHQGSLTCPVDFILPLGTAGDDDTEGRQRLVANCLSQARALMMGRDEASARQSLLDRGLPSDEAEELAPHLVIPGNRPCNMLVCDRFSPETLGALLALYEHKTFCSGHIWQVNSFDQWGVELGKEIGTSIYSAICAGDTQGFDPSTNTLLGRVGNDG